MSFIHRHYQSKEEKFASYQLGALLSCLKLAQGCSLAASSLEDYCKQSSTTSGGTWLDLWALSTKRECNVLLWTPSFTFPKVLYPGRGPFGRSRLLDRALISR